jgi:chemotaxis methyl-accepting protein methylase
MGDILIGGRGQLTTLHTGATNLSDELAAIFQYVKEQRKIDFGIYRHDTIARRLNLLLSATGARDYSAYLELIKRVPSELDRLITTLTITTSHFFRNPHVFDVLAEIVIPEMLRTFGNETLRIWCAGCGRGEEVYSIAILFKEIMGKSDNKRMPVIVATDIDEKALKAAADGRYSEDVLHEARKKDIERYFTAEGDYYRVSDSIRSMVHFAVHDVITCKTPREGIFWDYHLILCRNVLIYFNRETQARVLQCLSDMLRPHGCLVLGEAELLSSPEFHEVAPRTRIFFKRGITA